MPYGNSETQHAANKGRYSPIFKNQLFMTLGTCTTHYLSFLFSGGDA